MHKNLERPIFLVQGKLKKDKNGNFIVIKWIKTMSKLKGDQGDYHEHNAYGGVVMPQLNVGEYPEAFQIFNAKEKIVEEDHEKIN